MERSTWMPPEVIERIARRDCPPAQRRELIEDITRVCRDRHVPLPLLAEIYGTYLGAAVAAGVELPPGDRVKILISDDDADVSDAMQLFLEIRLEGLRDVVVVDQVRGGDGRETLDCILAERFSVLLVDEGKPTMCGSQLAKHYREYATDSDLAIVCCTGYAPSPVPQNDFDACLSKPVNPSELVTTLLGCSARDRVPLLALRRRLLDLVPGEPNPRHATP